MFPEHDPYGGEPATGPLSAGGQSNDSDDEMCDHDEHKEVVTLQEMRGGSALGLSGQVGSGEPVIVCKKCGKAQPVERVDEERSPFIL